MSADTPSVRPTATTPSTAAPAAPAGVEPTHGCVRCGAPVPVSVAMCERCNPLGLSQPAASQAHGTAVLGVVLAVVVLAILANLALSGVGPFEAHIATAVADPPGLNVTLVVTNTGSRSGATTCRIYDPHLGIGPETAYVQTPRIEPGATITFNRRVTEIVDVPQDLAVLCRDL